MSCEFRRLTPAEGEWVLKLVAEIEAQQGLGADFYWPQKDLQEELWVTHAWGAIADGKLLAFILCRESKPIWEITCLASSPLGRRQGLMSQLFKTLIDAKHHDTEIWLEVHEKNLPAQKLYEKLGFRQVAVRTKYYRDGGSAWLYSYPPK